MQITIRSGGQSGVDQAAIELALELGLPYEGWCPKDGWAEGFETPPGVRRLYPDLQATPSADPRQRTAWNVRDSDATLILVPEPDWTRYPGTELTRVCAELVFLKPLHVATLDEDALAPVGAWLRTLGPLGPTGLHLNIAGPRASEAEGIRARTKDCLRPVLSELVRR